MPRSERPAVSRPSVLAKPAPRPPLARFAGTLAGLQPEGRATTRGPQEVQVYQQAAPAVVLVVTDEAFGSGALISEDGKIVTNLHVVGAAETVGVVFKPAAEDAKVGEPDIRTAKVIRRDGMTDLALLQVEPPPGVKPLVLGDSGKLQVGADVHAIGHPTGRTWTYTRGIVSQIRKDHPWSIDARTEHRATLIQTQTPINPGNSGGPLIADDLTIVGINSFKSEGEGLNFAVSAEDVKAFLTLAEDRAAPKAPSRIPEGCELTVLAEEPTKKPAGIMFIVDETCDGEPDFVILEPKRKRDPVLYMFDEDGDGKVELTLLDFDRDGAFDAAFYDTDGDGEADLRGDFRNGEDEPYRWEKLK
ncbi:MAG: S1C family serine protease [Phenylobacterium sp.]|uniref:S1C family serine protease n=1 Tax=Phenylobacterium sp. TaxID=1871053 RepID=UPI00391DFE27